MEQSEFGTVVDTIHGGKIVRNDNGEVRYVSEAFNPLSEAQLMKILNLMRELTK